MSDEIDKLRKALQSAPPAPEEGAKAATIARAMQAFDQHSGARRQGSASDLRPMSDRPRRAGFLTGVLKMLMKLSSRPALAATVSAAALSLGLFAVLPVWQGIAPTLPQMPQPLPELVGRIDAPAPVGDDAAPDPATAPALAKTAAAETGTSLDADATSPAEPPVAPMIAESEVEKRDRSATTAAVPGAEFIAGGSIAMDAIGPADGLLMAPASPAPLRREMAEPAAGLLADMRAQSAAPLTEMAAPEPILAPMPPEADAEAFANEAANPVRIVADDPVSTFSTDADTASYAVIRSSLTSGYLPPPEAVRIEEMVNYFPYAYAAPEAGGGPFLPRVRVVATPWNPNTRLVHIGLQGAMPALEDRPPLNLVFLIDTSGSMQDADKLPLLKQSFAMMLGALRPEDRVAIVTYAGSAGQVLEATPAGERRKILAALDRLEAGGSTAGQEGLQQAYSVAEAMADEGGAEGAVTRVILATDGDFNVGISDPEALKSYIEGKRKSGTYLSVLGFGRGNLDDATMQALAQNGNGTAAYIDTIGEAQKVLVDQLTGALFPIADDVKVQVEFNPAVIAEYRLIGYETRALAREDFNNDRVDAGEIGAGHRVTAIYEVTPVGSPARMRDPLRYTASAEPEAVPEAAPASMELGFLKLRYKAPGESVSRLIEMPIAPEPGEADAETRFAVAIAGFGQLLTGASYLGDWGWDEAIALANGARGEDAFGYRAEAVQLMRLAQSLAN